MTVKSGAVIATTKSQPSARIEKMKSPPQQQQIVKQIPLFKRRRCKLEWLQDIKPGWLQVREAGICQTLGDERDMTRA